MDFLKLEMRFHDTGGLDTSPKDILLGGNVIGLGYSIESIKIVGGGVVKLVFSRSKIEMNL